MLNKWELDFDRNFIEVNSRRMVKLHLNSCHVRKHDLIGVAIGGLYTTEKVRMIVQQSKVVEGNNKKVKVKNPLI